MPTEDLYPPRLVSEARFIETLAVKGGLAVSARRHLARMLQTLEAFGAPSPSLVLEEAERCITSCLRTLSGEACQQIHRLTLTYTPRGIEAVRLIPYRRRSVRRLVPIELPTDFDYTYKYADRSFFTEMSSRLGADEEPIFYRSSGELTDTTFTNVVLDLPEGLMTPRHPLLAGTRRASLLDEGRIQEADLVLEDLRRSRAVYLINALRSLG